MLIAGNHRLQEEQVLHIFLLHSDGLPEQGKRI